MCFFFNVFVKYFLGSYVGFFIIVKFFYKFDFEVIEIFGIVYYKYIVEEVLLYLFF